MTPAKKTDPYKVLHWVLVASAGASFVSLVVLIAAWHQPWSGLAQVVASLLWVGGSVTGLGWVEQQRLNTTLPAQWAEARGEPSDEPEQTTSAPERQTAQAPAGDDDADWEAGE